jgi:hypothetical protein
MIIYFFISFLIPLRVAYISKCSRTVSPSKIASNYGQYPIRDLALSNPLYFVMSCPLMLRLPKSGYISPVKHLKQEVFPAPVIPRSAKHSP